MTRHSYLPGESLPATCTPLDEFAIHGDRVMEITIVAQLSDDDLIWWPSGPGPGSVGVLHDPFPWRDANERSIAGPDRWVLRVRRGVSTAVARDARFPHSCPRCAAPAYVGFSTIECSRSDCGNRRA